MTRRKAALLVSAIGLILGSSGLSRANPTQNVGCTTGAVVLVNGDTPSAECTFFFSCFPDPQSATNSCSFISRLDVNGTGQVQGSLTPSASIPAFPVVTCSGIGHCGNQASSGPQGTFAAVPYRCAANGLAVFVTVTCSVHVVGP